jgi:hypothetical protein
LVSVLIPITDEAEPLIEIHEALSKQLDRLGLGCEFLYLVGTARRESLDEVRSLWGRDAGRVRVLEFALPVTVSAMLAAGAEHATSEVLLTHPDAFEVDLDVLPKLWSAAVSERTDLAFASRTLERPRRKDLQSRLFNLALSRLTGHAHADVASRTRALRRSMMRELPLYGDYHRYLPLLAQRAGFSVKEIACREHPRAKPARVRSPAAYLWRATEILSVLFLTRFTRYPLRLFGGIGVVASVLGGVILLVVGVERILGTALAGRPILVLAALLIGLGVQTFAIGLLGELILFFHARRVRDYRIARIYQRDPAPLPEPISET